MIKFLIEENLPTKLFILRFFDTITWMIPPALPIFLSICQTIALIRLRGKGILGADTEKILQAGSVKIACFDKTGTLTTLSIEVSGYAPVF
jgi:cation-transporting ATPase 13A3/4/5